MNLLSVTQGGTQTAQLPLVSNKTDSKYQLNGQIRHGRDQLDEASVGYS